MKILFTLALCGSILFLSCKENNEVVSSPIVRSSTNESQGLLSTSPGVIPANDKVYEIALNPSLYTWADFDKYYKDEICKTESNESYRQSLKTFAISSMVNVFGLLEKADRKTLEFYILEQLELDFLGDITTFNKFLGKLKSMAATKEATEFANQRYERQMLYINNGGVMDRDKYLKDHGSDLEALRKMSSQ